jgi:hypothetical protein
MGILNLNILQFQYHIVVVGRDIPPMNPHQEALFSPLLSAANCWETKEKKKGVINPTQPLVRVPTLDTQGQATGIQTTLHANNNIKNSMRVQENLWEQHTLAYINKN